MHLSDLFVYICEYMVFILMNREYAKSFLLTFNLSIDFFVLIIKFSLLVLSCKNWHRKYNLSNRSIF